MTDDINIVVTLSRVQTALLVVEKLKPDHPEEAATLKAYADGVLSWLTLHLRERTAAPPPELLPYIKALEALTK